MLSQRSAHTWEQGFHRKLEVYLQEHKLHSIFYFPSHPSTSSSTLLTWPLLPPSTTHLLKSAGPLLLLRFLHYMSSDSTRPPALWTHSAADHLLHNIWSSNIWRNLTSDISNYWPAPLLSQSNIPLSTGTGHIKRWCLSPSLCPPPLKSSSWHLSSCDY